MAKKAFTLVEILIVILILGTLATIAMPIFQGMTIKAKLTHVFVDISAMERDWDMLVTEKGLNHDAFTAWVLIDDSKYFDYVYCAGLIPGIGSWYGVFVRTKESATPGLSLAERELFSRRFWLDGHKDWELGNPGHPWAKYIMEMLKGENVSHPDDPL